MTAEEAIRTLKMLSDRKKMADQCDQASAEDIRLYHSLDMAIEALRFKGYFDELYGIGLEVANWHQNGDLISFDGFYEAAMQISEVIENDNR